MKAIRAKWLVPMTDGDCDTIIEDGVVIFDTECIKAVGKFSDVQIESYVPIQHFENHVLVPGLINSHTHAAMSLLRGYGDDMSLHQWLHDCVWPVEKEFVGPDYVKLGTELAIYEMLRTGTTTFMDQYFHADVTAHVAETVGIRVACGESILDFQDGRLHAKIDSAIDQLTLFSQRHDSRYVIPILNTHACYTVPEDGLERVSQEAKELGCRVHIHLHESKHECDSYSDTHQGKSALETLIECGLFNDRLMAAHCVQLSETERRLFAQYGVNVIHCPKSNLKLASGICPVQALLDLGVNVSLGTDGACSNNGLSMLSEMQFAALVGKSVNGGDSTAVSCHTALRMATWNGAVTLGMSDRIGSIEPGKWADFVAIDLSSPDCLPVFDPISSLVYSTGARVSDVWVGGERRVRDGDVLAMRIDRSEIERITDRLKAFKAKRENRL
jgi:5-methylthioadenosine/S-adenosylhomocysteine deaminase